MPTCKFPLGYTSVGFLQQWSVARCAHIQPISEQLMLPCKPSPDSVAFQFVVECPQTSSCYLQDIIWVKVQIKQMHTVLCVPHHLKIISLI